MSSMQRGATGAGRPKPVNVNTLYSGRNLAAGNKPIGKHGLQSVGKSVGVVRRMPPPATLPSLKAENNGQDPTINIVPQSGTGWNKNESTPAPAPQEPAKPIITASATGPDLRPTWAKPPTAEPAPVNGSASAQPSNREFPTLAVSAQGKEGKPQNAWNTNALNMPQDGRSTSISSSYEDDRQLPSRYYDNASSKTGYRSRFQGSNDARASQPNYYSGGRVSESRDSERERGESMSESVSGRSESGRPTADSQASRRTTSESFFDKSEPAMVEAVPPSENIQKEQYSTATDIDREAAIERSRQKRMNYKSGPYDERSDAPAESYQKPAGQYNGHHQREQGGYQQQQQPRRWVQPQQPAAPPAPQPEYRLLKRPERIELEDISDEEEEIQMTKLNKPAVRVMKRVANGQDNSTENQEPPAKEPTAQPTGQKAERRVQSGETRRPQPEQAKRGDRPKTDENRQPAKANKVHNGGTDNRSGGGEKKAPIEEVSSAPPPSAENVWAKRQEERESQEKDHKDSMPKVMKQVIEQHFPDVKEAASMKVVKDQARQPADADFTRAALRARRAAASNDVRKMMGNDEERRPPHHQQSRQDRNYLDNERGGPPQRYQNNPRNQRGNREYNRDYNRDRDYDRQPQREYNNEEEPRYQQDRNYRDEGGNWERNHNRHNNEYSEEYYGGPREYTNSKVAGMRRGGRGIRGGFGRGRGRIAYSTGHAHSHPQPQYQIQRRPKEAEKQPEERGEKENEQKGEEENVSRSVKVEDANGEQPLSKSQNIQQASGDSATENTEVSKPLSGAGDSEPTESTEMPATAFEYKNDRQAKMNSRGGRWTNRGSAPRGRGETRRGRGTYQGAQEYRPRRVQHVPEEGVDENGKLPNEGEFTGPSRGRGRYSQQRVHRGQPRERGGGYNKHARSNANPHRSQPTGDFGAHDYRLKSPVASSEGHDEWETASESSGRIRHAGAEKEKESSPPKRVQQQPRRQPPRMSSDASRADAPHATERIRSKNGQPARRTCRSPSDVGSNRKQQQQQQEGEQQQQRKNSAEKSSSSSSSNNGLAGLDMNNYAGVVVIDDHLQETVSAEAVDEFEEVLNKKAKRAKALELQQKQEAEEKKRVKEAERVQRMQAKKAQRQNNKKEARKFEEGKRKESNDSSAKAAGNSTEPAFDKPRGPSTRKDIPVTTVWNSAHVAAMEKEGKEPDNGQATAAVIPSPIARPTPRSKSSASDTANAPKEEAQRALELPVTLSSSQPLRGDKYDFTFDPHIHEAQARESQEKTAVISTANSESGSVAEDYRLKEKLNKVKDLWQGELEKESPQPSLPSNVAKVKPQPQGGEPPAGDIAKTDAAVTAATSPQQNNGGPPQRSPAPAITPFSSSGFGGIGFPSSYNTMALSEMGQPARSFVAGSVMVPPNATSPPVSIPMGMSFVPQQQRGQANFVENPMYMQQHQQNMTWAPPTAPLEMPFGTSMSMQQPHQAGGGSQFAFAAGSRNVVHPQQMQQPRGGGFQPGGNGGLLTTHQAGHGQKMGGAGPHPPPMVPFGHPHHHHPHHRPMDMMNGGINMPPPPPQNMQGPPMQMGNAQQQQQPRGDRGQFNSMMGGGGPFNPSPQPPQHFNQPPPNMNMRFSQPPPPMNEMGWSKGGGGGNQQSRQHFGGGPRNQGNPGNRGGFSNYPTDVWSGMQQFVPNQFQQNSNNRMQHSGGKGAGNPIDHSNDLKRPSSGGSPQNAGTTA